VASATGVNDCGDALPPARLEGIFTINGSWPPTIPAFQPLWWLRGGHAQTLAAAYWPQRLPDYQALPRRVELDDGDVVIVHDDCPVGWKPGGITALVMHGLSGCHLSPLMVRLAAKLTARGVRVFRLDLRGCGAGVGLARRPYHAGRSDDVAKAVEAIGAWCEASPLVVIGVSLSGNILLKFLGEAPERVPSFVMRAVAVNPPIDLARSIATLSGPVNRWYDRHFVTALHRQLDEHSRRMPDAPMPTVRLQTRCLYDFDDWYTAPVSGFANAATYYKQCSAAQFVSRIRVPTVVLTAQDDPMIPVEMFGAATWSEVVHIAIAAGGGHVGYVARRGVDPDVHWIDWRIVDFVTEAAEPITSVSNATW